MFNVNCSEILIKLWRALSLFSEKWTELDCIFVVLYYLSSEESGENLQTRAKHVYGDDR